MQFLNPIWLWGLTGLTIPIGIHLLSRKEGRTIKIGSLRHLNETATTRFRSLRLQQYTLLALRCLLITLLVIFLSDPVIDNIGKKEKWTLVEKGLENDPDFKMLIDSLKNDGFQLRALTQDFPRLTDAPSQPTDVHYYNLLESLSKAPIQAAIVIAQNRFESFRGKRIGLPTNIQWITKNAVDHSFLLYKYSIGDSVVIRTGNSTGNKTTFQFQQSDARSTNNFDTVKAESPTNLSISIFHETTFANDARIMEAALHAIDNIGPKELSIQTYDAEKYPRDITSDWCILLGENFHPTTDQKTIYFKGVPGRNTKLFVLYPSATPETSWMLTQRLDEEIAIRENLAVQLASMLFAGSKYDSLLKRNDRRVMPESMLWATMNEDQTKSTVLPDATKVGKFILVLLLLTLFTERLISFKQNQ